MVEVDLDLAPPDPRRETRNREAVCVLGVEARPHVEGPSVRLAHDHAALEATAAQRKARMGTGVLHRMDVVADPVETDVDSVDAHAQAAIGGDVFEMGDAYERQGRSRRAVRHGR